MTKKTQNMILHFIKVKDQWARGHRYTTHTDGFLAVKFICSLEGFFLPKIEAEGLVAHVLLMENSSSPITQQLRNKNKQHSSL